MRVQKKQVITFVDLGHICCYCCMPSYLHRSTAPCLPVLALSSLHPLAYFTLVHLCISGTDYTISLQDCKLDFN